MRQKLRVTKQIFSKISRLLKKKWAKKKDWKEKDYNDNVDFLCGCGNTVHFCFAQIFHNKHDLVS